MARKKTKTKVIPGDVAGTADKPVKSKSAVNKGKTRNNMTEITVTNVTSEDVARARKRGHAAPSPVWKAPPEPPEPPRVVLHGEGGERRGRRHSLAPEINITETAAKIGITKSHLSKILSGVNRPSLPVAINMAHVLGCTTEDVLKLYRPKPRGGK